MVNTRTVGQNDGWTIKCFSLTHGLDSLHAVVAHAGLSHINAFSIGGDEHLAELFVTLIHTHVGVLSDLTDERVLGKLTTSVGEYLVAENNDIDIVALAHDVINTIEVYIENGTIASKVPASMLGHEQVVTLDIVQEAFLRDGSIIG